MKDSFFEFIQNIFPYLEKEMDGEKIGKEVEVEEGEEVEEN